MAVQHYLSAETGWTENRPSAGWLPRLDARELWAFRELAWILALRDLKLRYKQTAFGLAWAVLQPLAGVLVFSIVFGKLAKLPSDGIPYPVFVYAALSVWVYVSTSVDAAAMSLVESRDLVTKAYFPRVLAPFAAVLPGLLDLGISKMSDLRRAGRTVVFVSHDLGAVSQLCPRSIWLDRGEIKADGPTSEMVDSYLRSGIAGTTRQDFELDPHSAVQLMSVAIVDESCSDLDMARRDEAFAIAVRFRTARRIANLDMSVFLVNHHGRVIDDTWSDNHPAGSADEPGEYEALVTIPPMLRAGEYSVGVWFGNEYESFLEREVLSFRVWPRPDDRHEQIERPRVVQPIVDWQVSRRPVSDASLSA